MRSNYEEVHNVFMTWIQDGVLKFDGSYDRKKLACLDKFLVKFFNCDKPKTGIRDGCVRLDGLLERGEIDIDWLFGPNAYAVFRAKLAQRGLDDTHS